MMKNRIFILVLFWVLSNSMKAEAMDFFDCKKCWKVFGSFLEIPESELLNLTVPKEVSNYLNAKYNGISKDELLIFLKKRRSVLNTHIVETDQYVILSFYFPQNNHFLAYQVWFTFNVDGLLSKVVFGTTLDYSDDILKLMEKE